MSYYIDMKVSPVSFSNTKSCVNHNVEQSFWYTRQAPRHESHALEYFWIATGTLSITAVLVTLFNLGAKKPILKNVFVV